MPGFIHRTMKTCKPCEDAAQARSLPETAQQIGATVVEEYLGGKDTCTFSYHQCSECGSVWEKQVDGGAGGHYRGIKRLSTE